MEEDEMEDPVEDGKRVLIKDKKHPWYGQTGALTDFMLDTGQLVVELDNGMNAGCFLEQLDDL